MFMVYDKLKILDRVSINNILDNMFDYKLTYITASIGYGKTIAVKNFIDKCGIQKVFWTTFSDYCNSSNTLADDFFNKLENEFELDIQNYKSHKSIIDELNRKFFDKIIFIFDDYHLNNSNIISDFIQKLYKLSNNNFFLIIISRQIPDIEIELNNDCLILYQNVFQFSKKEIEELFFINNVSLSTEQIDMIYSYSEGWSSCIYLMLMEYKRNGSFSIVLGANRILKKIIHSNFSESEIVILVKLSFLDSFVSEQAEYITSDKNTLNLIKNLSMNCFFTNYNVYEKKYSFHKIFKDTLQEELNKYDIELNELYILCGDWFYSKNDYIHAIENYYKAGDYNKIYNVIENVYSVEYIYIIPDIIKNIFENMDDSTKLKFSISYITYIYSYIFCIDSVKGNFIFNEAKLFFERNLNYDNLVFAEINLLEAFNNYADVKKFFEFVLKAVELFGYNKSKIINDKMALNFGVPCILYLYHTNIGKMSVLCQKLQKAFPLFQKITNNCGLGIEDIILSEYYIETGQYDKSEKLSEKAIYKAKFANQISVLTEAKSIKVRLYLINGKYKEAEKILEEIEMLIQHTVNPSIISQIEMTLGYGWGIIGKVDKIPEWILFYDLKKSKALFGGAQACFVMFGIAMILKNDFKSLEAHSEIMENAFEVNKNLYRLIYALLFNTILNFNQHYYEKAKNFLLKAIEIAATDNIRLPFIELSPHYYDILKIVSEINDYAANILSECHSYTKNYNKYNNITLKKFMNLSKREIEVMEMIANGKKQKEIAEILVISLPTVKSHIKNIYNKLGVCNKLEAMNKWTKI